MDEAASEAARRLFHEHGAAVYRFAVVLLRRHQDAEDVTQETFMKLLQHLQSGGNADNLRGWLFTVAAHGARDRQRGSSRWLPWSWKYDGAVQPDALHDEDGHLAAFRSTLEFLPARDRSLLALKAQGLSYREIAAAAGIKETSVGQLLARAIERWARGTKKRQTGDRYEPSYGRQDSGRR